MGSIQVVNNGTYGTYTFSSSNADKSTGNPPQIFIAVGAPYTITCQAKSGQGNVTSIRFHTNTGALRFIRQSNPDNGSILTSYYLSEAKIEGNNSVTASTTFPSDFTWNLATPETSASVNFFVSKNDDSDIILLDTHYSSGHVESGTQFQITMQAPSSTMTFVKPDTSHQLAFGPYRYWYKDDTGKRIYEWLRITNWSDQNYMIGVPGVNYGFGGETAGLPPWHTSGTCTNTTHSDGAFFMTQLGYIFSSQSEWYETITYEDVSSVISDSPTYPNGASIPCLDKQPDNPGPAGYPYSWGPITQAFAQGGQQSIPPPNTVQDPNGNNVSYYYDAPSSGWTDVSITKSDGTYAGSACYYQVYYNINFYTYIVFQADGGIPIGLNQVFWYIAVHEDNSTARTSGSWVDGRVNPSMWSGYCNGVWDGTYSPNTYYLTWPELLEDNINNPHTSRKKRAPKLSSGSPNGSPLGNGGMGGSPAMQSPYGAPYPKAGIANVRGMN